MVTISTVIMAKRDLVVEVLLDLSFSWSICPLAYKEPLKHNAGIIFDVPIMHLFCVPQVTHLHWEAQNTHQAPSQLTGLPRAL